MLLIKFENIFVIALCIMERPAAMLAAVVELALLVDSIIWHVEGGVFSTFGADNAVTFKIALMCHRNILLILLSVITVSFTMILGIVRSSDE